MPWAGIRSTLWSGRTCLRFWSTKEQAYLVYGDEVICSYERTDSNPHSLSKLVTNHQCAHRGAFISSANSQ